MKINIQAIKFDADSKLLALVEKKFSRLEHYYDGIVGAEVTMSVEHGSETYSIKKVKARLEIAGSDLFAECKDKTFEKAVSSALDTLKRQLVRYKEKLQER